MWKRDEAVKPPTPPSPAPPPPVVPAASAPTVTSLLVDTLVWLPAPNWATAVAPVGALPVLQFEPVLQLPFALSIQMSEAACAEGSAAATASAIELRRRCFRLLRWVADDLRGRAATGCSKISGLFLVSSGSRRPDGPAGAGC